MGVKTLELHVPVSKILVTGLEDFVGIYETGRDLKITGEGSDYIRGLRLIWGIKSPTLYPLLALLSAA